MKLAVIAQSIAGVAVVGGGGLFVVAPNWLGIYYDIDIYAMDNSNATVTVVDGGADPVAGGGTVDGSTSKDPNAPKMNCKIEGQDPYECSVFSLTTNPVDAKKSINFSEFNKEQLTSVPTAEDNATKYYKITVSEHLLQKFQNNFNNNTKNIEVSWTTGSDSDSKITLQALFSYDKQQSKIIPIDKANLDKYHYVGQVTKLPQPKDDPESNKDSKQTTPAPTTEITKGSKGYSCTWWKTSSEACSIYKLSTSDNAELNNITFEKQTDPTDKISDNNVYLIETTTKQDSSIFIKTMSENEAAKDKDEKIMKVQKLQPAIVLAIGDTNKLFFF